MAEMTLERKAAQIKVKKLLAALANQPMTPPEICELLHLGEATTRIYLNKLKSEGKIHIKKWTSAEVCGLRGRPRPLYALGAGTDAPQPAKNKYRNHKLWYANLKKDPLRYEAFKARCRQRHQNKKFVPRPDIAASWIPRRGA